jgi:hypothetical protein
VSSPPLLWIPTAALMVQEQLERLAQGGDLTSVLAAEPLLLAGLLLQVPCGLIAVWLVRALLRNALWPAFTRRSAHAVRLGPLAGASLAFVSSPLRPAALASRHAGRAPPLAV